MAIDKIFIVTAAASFERQQIMKSRMESTMIPYEFYISGGIPLFEQCWDLIKENKENKQWLDHPNEFSVTAAHLNVIKIAKDRGYENVLIFEDDVILHQDFDINLARVLKTLPDDFNIAYLVVNNQTPYDEVPINDDWILTKGSSLACGYIVSKKAYDQILDFYRDDYQVIDVFYYHWSYNNPCYVVKEYLVVPDPNTLSSITGNFYKDHTLDYTKYKNNNVTSHHRNDSMVWSILICSVPGRFGTLEKLVNQLEHQIGYRKIEILYLGDNRFRTIGAKRNDLARLSQGKYCSYIDDDDSISDDYIDKIYEHLDKDYDVICYGVRVSGYDEFIRPAIYSIEYEDLNFHDKYHRKPNHIMTIKREHVIATPFTEEKVPDEFNFAADILPRLKKEKSLPDILYYYDYDPTNSESS